MRCTAAVTVRCPRIVGSDRDYYTSPPRPLQPSQTPAGAVDEIEAEAADEEAEGETQVRPLEGVREDGAHPASGEHAHGDDQGRAEVDVPVPVVLEDRGQADGRQQHGEAGAGGLVLREAGP